MSGFVRSLLALALLLAWFASFAADRAFAADTADDLKKRGNELMLAGRARDAIPLYEEGFAKSHDPAFLYNLGRAYESLGQYADALDRLEAFDRNVTSEQRGALPDLPKYMQFVRDRVSSLTIVVSADGAVVKIDGRVVGESPMPKEVRRNAGTVRLDVLKDGYEPYSEEVKADPGRVRVKVALVLREKATLHISSVAGAAIIVDGKPAGTAPGDVMVPPGEHEIALQKEGYERASTRLTVRADETRDVSLALSRERSVLTRWWFWTAVGAVAVGGAVTAVILTRDPPNRTGTIPPGDVGTPLLRF